MSDTPRTDEVYEQFGPVANPVAMGYHSLCCELERENGKLRSALLKTTGSLGLIIGGAGSHGTGHKDNYENAKRVLDETFHDET